MSDEQEERARCDGPGQIGEVRGISYTQFMVGVEWKDLEPVPHHSDDIAKGICWCYDCHIRRLKKIDELQARIKELEAELESAADFAKLTIWRDKD